MTSRTDEREPQWGPSYAEQTAGHAKRQTELLEGIGRALEESGNRDYTESHPVPDPVDLSGVQDGLEAVSGSMDGVHSALDDVVFVTDRGFDMLAFRLGESEEVLRSIDDYVGGIPGIERAVDTSNVLLTSIGAGIGFMAKEQMRVARRREGQLDDIGETLQEGFEGVQVELADVRHAVEDGLADVAGAVHQGAERVAGAVEDGFSVQHRLLHALGISLERHTTLGHLQHLDLMRRLLHLHDAQMAVQRQESASIQATMRELAANGRKIEAEELYSFALINRAAGDTSAAIRNLRKALKKRNTFAEAWYMLGVIAFENGFIDAARDAFSLAERYAYAQELGVEEKALNALLELERFLRNEKAWRDLLLLKYDRKFKMDRNTELFEVLRTWLKRCPNSEQPTSDGPRGFVLGERCPDPARLTDEQRAILMKELPRMIRESESCGVLVATQSEFALVRPHLADGVEQFGSWAYLFWDLNVIALRALCLYYHGKCSCCGKELPEHIRPPLLDLARAIRALLRTALQEFSHGVPVQFVTSYRGLMEARGTIDQIARCRSVCKETLGDVTWIRCKTATHEFHVMMLKVFKAVPFNV